MTCKDCIHYCICRDTVAYDRWCEFKCSICGLWSNTLPRAKEKYCPGCGARMDGGKK